MKSKSSLKNAQRNMRRRKAHRRPPRQPAHPTCDDLIDSDYHDMLYILSIKGASPQQMADIISCDVQTINSQLAQLHAVEIRRSAQAKARLYIDAVIKGKWRPLKFFLQKYVLDSADETAKGKKKRS